MRIVSKSDIGRMRRTNQDAYAAGELTGNIAWAVVCDGMGGANGGNIASQTAVKVISEKITNNLVGGMNSSAIKSLLNTAIYTANLNVFDMAKSVETLSGMGTTVVAAIICDDVLHIAHAGDSRAYIISGDTIKQITKDHSIVQHMVELGQITSEEAKVHPKKNVITRALGVEETIQVDYTEIPFNDGDIIMLCTDGLSNFIDSKQVMEILNSSNFYEFSDRLVDTANKNGGGDNITVVVIAK
ncbi:MAG: Stp1/IreP family PP2C-type Ser/Thr phosphatase [Acutalibacteraceae bacterium]